MAGRSNTTLKKRQKEMARAEKQRDKFAKRLERKKGDLNGQPDSDVEQVVGDSVPTEATADDISLQKLIPVAP
jgi:uncharacterized protein YgiM (DUF1202 family)